MTRMYSSRMCTVHCSSHLLGGVCPAGRGSAQVHAGIHTPLWIEWQTGVKTLPCRNYVTDGKNDKLQILKTDSLSNNNNNFSQIMKVFSEVVLP